jgi:nicotinamidase-related amidase
VEKKNPRDQEKGMGYGNGKGKEIKTLLSAGANTGRCVLGTRMDAYHAGWGRVLVEDCRATANPGRG